MRPALTTPAESNDTVGHVIALLERFPEIATIASHPLAGSVVVSFAINGRLDRAARDGLRDSVVDHVRALMAAFGEEPQLLAVTWELDEKMSFIRVARDVRTLTRDELSMLTALFAERFGDALLRSPAPEEFIDEDLGVQDDAVDYAIEALRDGTDQKSLVGIREEKRVLVYFLKARKKSKRSAR
ncbi:MAG: hypothetical protein JO043_05645 [Candidatus Eremiobacteraeota bacterium]|nr:hypothetical protein [Candidatus Eremiobacteraeota bacterium]